MSDSTTQNIIKITSSAFAIILATLLFVSSKNTPSQSQVQGTTINAEGKQIVTLLAKGGYYPPVINVPANTEAILRVKTQSTFDCSSALTIPQLGVVKNLPPSGETDIAVPAQPAGTKIAGTCSMGMYNFTLTFN